MSAKEKAQTFLVLTRKLEQSVVIDPDSEDPVEVKVLGLGEGKVKLGFSTDSSRFYVRKELLEKAKNQRIRNPKIKIPNSSS